MQRQADGQDEMLAPARSRHAVHLAVACGLVACAVWITFGPVLSARARLFDDEQYLHDNRLVRHPSGESVRRFFGEVLTPSTVQGYYQPLAMTSLMLDVAAGGSPDNLRPFHRTSLALHVLNTVLVILLMNQLFRSPLAAMIAGLLFGLHPLAVEPVAWVGERKTVLATFFAILSLISYVSYARRTRGSGKPGGRPGVFYIVAIASYLLALLSKPTSTPVAILLLLLDFWPLQRLGRGRGRIGPLLAEKVPFLVFGAVFAIITYVSQARTAGVVTPASQSAGRMTLILCHNIMFYLGKIVWPAHLTPQYLVPSPLSLAAPTILAGVIGTVVLIIALAVSLKWTRALVAGFLFFFVALLPTLGIVGFTNVLTYDKYAYFPAVGLLIVLSWAASTFLLRNADAPVLRRRAQAAAVLIAAVALAVEAVTARAYIAKWSTTESLSRHMLDLAPRSAVVHNHMGNALADRGDSEGAIAHYTAAIKEDPAQARAHYNLALELLPRGQQEAAIDHLRAAVHYEPRFAEACTNLGTLLSMRGEWEEAETLLRRAIGLKPDAPKPHNNLALVLSARGRADEAIAEYREAVRLEPDYADARCNLAFLLARQGRIDEAAAQYRAVLERHPGMSRAIEGLQNLTAGQGSRPD